MNACSLHRLPANVGNFDNHSTTSRKFNPLMSGPSSRPLLSILSAVYNEERHIGEMIQSVLAQDFQDWELVIVDDGSSDRTADRVDEYTTGDPRIRLVERGTRMGKVAAFNRAFTASRGAVLVLLAGDDRLPMGSLANRTTAITSLPDEEPSVAFFRLRTFSGDARFHGMILPRRGGSSRSGGSITMNRPLAEKLFPIPPNLVSEDIWLAHGSVLLAHNVVERPEIVLEYRIHPGNSNPRGRSFREMTNAMHERHTAWLELLGQKRILLSSEERRALTGLWYAEQLRYAGKTLQLLMVRDVPLIDRLAMAGMSHPALHSLRRVLYRPLSGWRRA